MIDLTYINGDFVPRSEAKISVEDRGFQFGESLFEMLPIVNREPRFLPKHYERLASGIEWMELKNGVPDLAAVERICAELIEKTGIVEGMFYLQVTGGNRPRNYRRISPPPVTVVAYVIPFRFPRAEDAAKGIAAVTAPDPRWAHPVYKTTMLLSGVMQKRHAARRGADEVILHGEDGTLHEGASSTVFLI